MQAYILLGPSASLDGGGGPSAAAATTNPKARSLLSFRSQNQPPLLWSSCSHHHRSFSRCSAAGRNQNHYAVLGVSADASPSDIKKAYRLLALKYHPDVSKDAGADETFKNIRLAYEILSNETTRNEYDRDLKYHHSDESRPLEGSWSYSTGLEEQLRIYRWAYLQRKMQREKYRQQNQTHEKRHSFYNDEDQEEVPDKNNDDQERGPFTEVLQSTLITLFLMHTVGIRLSLTFSSIMAFLDQKLDGGYKVGYFIAWMLGGSGGIMLTLCLSFASWLCGKASSSLVALVVVSMWFVSNLARFVPLPQGALLTLLYMSIRLQVDLK